MHKFSAPDEAQLAQLSSLDPEAPIAALNLFQFNARAQYAPGDEEFGTDAANVTGEEAYARYGSIAGEVISELGGGIVFSTPVDQVMIGPSDQRWDQAAIMYFPTRRAFVGMLRNADFQAASRHRKAALSNHVMLHLDGKPFVESRFRSISY
jgi:uncharacterized protein (DUF1330 family)